ncbi:MAG: SGNH/GDSL hydrolase family protein [Clostridia bacterium]|nr:SGNH/GDSL hydrolase family protein [Clostridia bacterium]
MEFNRIPLQSNINSNTKSYTEYFPVRAPIIKGIGSNIQRTMQKLATSTPMNRKSVRILFYGQSITKQLWTKNVGNYIKSLYPYADLTIKNLAIGGFDAERLVRTAKNDILSFYPDLVIMHVYGNEEKYKKIISDIKTYTTAEIMLQDDHVRSQECENWEYHELWSAVKLPSIAEEYECELVKIRQPWKEYLKTNCLEAEQLLLDGSHLNNHGEYLMTELYKPYFHYEPTNKKESNKFEKTYVIGEDIDWNDGKLTLPFYGNRVDVIASSNAPASIKILLDNKIPKSIPEGFIHTRPNDIKNRVWSWEAMDWPWETGTIKRVSWVNDPLEEEWSVRFTRVEEDVSYFEFKVYGSHTGYDGDGNNKEKFISMSGRVVIEPEDWFIKEPHDIVYRISVQEGYEIKWETFSMCLDEYRGNTLFKEGYENATTIIQGVDNHNHTLELFSKDCSEIPISAIKVYSP